MDETILRCDGQGRTVVTDELEIFRTSRYAVVSCPECGRVLFGPVITSKQDRLSWVVVPRHIRKRRVVTVAPRREFL